MDSAEHAFVAYVRMSAARALSSVVIDATSSCTS